MDLGLQDKIALVTGAGRGIGAAVAAALLDEGAHVVAGSRTATPELDALAERGAHVVIADITDPGAPQQLVDQALERFGALDVLVNNVGAASVRTGFLDVDDEEWHRIFDVTLFSAVRTSRAALPALLDGGGSIVNVASINARLPFPMVVDYSAAKAAMISLSTTLSEEFAGRGVRVNAVSPGPVRTPLWTAPGGFAQAMTGDPDASAQQVLDEMVPTSMGITTGRVTEAHEVADVVLFLASPRTANITGADVVIDGGQTKTA